MITTATIPFQLKQLRLPSIRDSFEDITLTAEKEHWSYQQYLAALCEIELAGREQRRLENNLDQSKLPVGKTLDTFLFENLTSINPAQITAFAETPAWVHQAHNLILFGPSGVGKTHLAAAIGRRLIEKGIKVLFVKTTALVQELQQAYQEHKLQNMLEKLAKYELLILDDIGYVKKTEAEISVLFDLIADRYESRSLLVTANQSFDKWETIFPNQITAVAAIDRLIHHSTIIKIDEKSYRLMSKLPEEQKENNERKTMLITT